MKFVQVGIDLTAPTTLHATAPDIPVPDNIAAGLEAFISWYDAQDVKPGDGSAEIAESFKIRLPFIGSVNAKGDFFVHVKTV